MLLFCTYAAGMYGPRHPALFTDATDFCFDQSNQMAVFRQTLLCRLPHCKSEHIYCIARSRLTMRSGHKIILILRDRSSVNASLLINDEQHTLLIQFTNKLIHKTRQIFHSMIYERPVFNCRPSMAEC